MQGPGPRSVRGWRAAPCFVDDGGGEVVLDALEMFQAGVDDEAEGVGFGPVEMGAGGADAFARGGGEPHGGGRAQGLGRDLGLAHGAQRRAAGAGVAYWISIRAAVRPAGRLRSGASGADVNFD